MDFKQSIINAVKKEANVEVALEVPPNPDLGDFALPCFQLAKALRKNPAQIAQELAKKLAIKGIARIEAKGPYLNFFVDKGTNAEKVLTAISDDALYGSSGEGKGKHALIEHTSNNPNADIHVGRARNSIIADSVVRLLKFQGYATDVHYFVNDIGKQIAMLVLAANGKKPAYEQLLKLYVDFNAKLKENDDLEQDVFALLKKLEDGDAKVRKQFRGIVDNCIKGQRAILSDVGIEFDSFDYESEYLFNKRTEEVLAALKRTGKLFTDEQQRQVLDLKGFPEVEKGMKNPVLVLTRSDGTSLYPLRDIAYTMDKASWAKGRNILLLGEDQKLYFQQVAAALSLLKVAPPEIVHYAFIVLADGKMSTRSGNVVLFSEFAKEAVERARKEILARTPDMKGKALDALARMIGHGAIKFSIIKVSPDKMITFDWDQALSFEGDSGPYVQYAYARINSILEKHKRKRPKPDYSVLTHEAERNLINHLGRFPDAVSQASKNLEPHVIANYARELAQLFTAFYHSCPVLQAGEDRLVDARLALCIATQSVLKTALGLLGIDTPESM
ncbi:arginine--tRNA ligase [Candidatus Woesearchaeota archaeon]|nr:arginine--tRNA ligase [Candidatus Woesearchaeota archaeon]